MATQEKEALWNEFKSLLKQFDFHYMYSDDHSVWKKHSTMSNRINAIYKELSVNMEDKIKADTLYAAAQNNLTVK